MFPTRHAHSAVAFVLFRFEREMGDNKEEEEMIKRSTSHSLSFSLYIDRQMNVCVLICMYVCLYGCMRVYVYFLSV